MSERGEWFIPATMARAIGGGVYFRPIRSWHSATYAGEGLTKIPGTNDGSGCLFSETLRGLKVALPPSTVTHRLYWHERNPDDTISAFLSYPDSMGACDVYFWEALRVIEDEDITRFFGDNAEAEMETAIRDHFAKDNPNA